MKTIKSILFYVLYYLIGKHLPKSNSRLSLGSMSVRRFLARGFCKHIGKGVNIERGAEFGRNLSVLDNSGIGIRCVIQGTVTIGKNVMMGPEVWIYTRNHRHDRADIPMIAQGFEDERPVIINDDVWIGSRVTILPGVTIGEGAIVGASAVVTKDVPPYTVVGGNPARVMKNRKRDD